MVQAYPHIHNGDEDKSTPFSQSCLQRKWWVFARKRHGWMDDHCLFLICFFKIRIFTLIRNIEIVFTDAPTTRFSVNPNHLFPAQSQMEAKKTRSSTPPSFPLPGRGATEARGRPMPVVQLQLRPVSRPDFCKCSDSHNSWLLPIFFNQHSIFHLNTNKRKVQTKNTN